MTTPDQVLLALIAILMLAVAGYAFREWRKMPDPYWRASTNGKCELCRERQAILASNGMRVCAKCDELLP